MLERQQSETALMLHDVHKRHAADQKHLQALLREKEEKVREGLREFGRCRAS
jgi:hypothetical protein